MHPCAVSAVGTAETAQLRPDWPDEGYRSSGRPASPSRMITWSGNLRPLGPGSWWTGWRGPEPAGSGDLDRETGAARKPGGRAGTVASPATGVSPAIGRSAAGGSDASAPETGGSDGGDPETGAQQPETQQIGPRKPGSRRAGARAHAAAGTGPEGPGPELCRSARGTRPGRRRRRPVPLRCGHRP